jgi:REP element-mobilizing transposase RayT
VGSTLHVTSRGIRREPIYANDADRRMFMAFLAQSIYKCRWTCMGYCLMTNHYHVLLSLSSANLSKGMHRLNGVYARRFNEVHEYTGHLFEARFSANLNETEEHFLEAVRYVALNPVSAGLCDDPADWPWSSFRAIAGLEPCPRFLAAARVRRAFGSGARGAELYARFIRDPIPVVTGTRP